MPLELRPETEAYRLCQPMHVLSFGEGLFVCVFYFHWWNGFPCFGIYAQEGRNSLVII